VFYKNGDPEDKTGLVWENGTSEREKNIRKGYIRVNRVKITMT
jgi:hypothetical protein